jgi:hypothetical protein
MDKTSVSYRQLPSGNVEAYIVIDGLTRSSIGTAKENAAKNLRNFSVIVERDGHDASMAHHDATPDQLKHSAADSLESRWFTDNWLLEIGRAS